MIPFSLKRSLHENLLVGTLCVVNLTEEFLYMAVIRILLPTVQHLKTKGNPIRTTQGQAHQ